MVMLLSRIRFLGVVGVLAFAGSACGSAPSSSAGLTVEDPEVDDAGDSEQLTLSGVPYDVAAVGSVEYAFPPPASVDEMLESAELVVRGVAKETSMYVEDEVTPITVQSFEIEDVIMGDIESGATIEVELMGGVIGDERSGGRIYHEMGDEPQFESDEEYLLVLRRNPAGTLVPVGPAAGRYKILDGVLHDRDIDLLEWSTLEPSERRSEAAHDDPSVGDDPLEGELLSGMAYEEAVDVIRDSGDSR
ncbi:hypothetical protein FTX61_21625 [Nitriliruptoraceae bacterium ZYF776]|nr:hypothetical protein [Profundirhabdus halotolerans]